MCSEQSGLFDYIGRLFCFVVSQYRLKRKQVGNKKSSFTKARDLSILVMDIVTSLVRVLAMMMTNILTQIRVRI